MKKIPYTAKDFSWVNWTPKQMKKLAHEALAYKKKSYATIKSILPEKRTYENTVFLLERSAGPYEDALRKISFLGEVSPKEEVRKAAHDIMVELSEKLVDIEYDRDLYISLLEYYEGNFSDEKKSLGQDDIKLLEETIRDYKRMGFDLPEDSQKKLKSLLKKVSTLGEHFRNNINNYNDYILCTEKELDGLSPRVIETLPRHPNGKYIVSLQYPHIGPFMAFAKNRTKRKELAEKNLKKGGKKNLKIIQDIVKLRAEIANMLGYKHHADFKTENRMAKTGASVDKFQHDLLKQLRPLAKRDLEALRTHAKSLGIQTLEHYDLAFVGNDLKKKKYDVDPEALRAYFPLPHVLEVMFTMYGNLFGIVFKPHSTKLWHKDARLYEVQNKNGSLVGYLTLDLHPRPGKFGHAACFDTVVPRELTWRSDKFIAPFTSIVCNFSIPTKSTPSLLSHGEIETLFHEFGHSLHMTLSLSRHESQSGANVAWDFVETPSQIMENWAWHDTVIAKLGKHIETGQTIPKSVREKMIKGRTFQSGYMYLRQVIMGKLDMDLHTGRVKDGAKAYREMTKLYTGINLPKNETLFPAGFGHLVGYDAGYYSYLWALVYACDAFSEFEKKGIFNKTVGERWRKEVLEKGSSEDEMKLITKFLRRKPNQKAFLKEVIG